MKALLWLESDVALSTVVLLAPPKRKRVRNRRPWKLYLHAGLALPSGSAHGSRDVDLTVSLQHTDLPCVNTRGVTIFFLTF